MLSEWLYSWPKLRVVSLVGFIKFDWCESRLVTCYSFVRSNRRTRYFPERVYLTSSDFFVC